MIAATEVTNWPERLVLTFLVVAMTLGVFGLMRWGWNNKKKVQAGLETPFSIPADFVAQRIYPGRYLASTAAGAWLTRIAVHDLGVPSRVEIGFSDAGIALVREGSQSFFIPASDVTGIRVDRAIAGRAFEDDGIAVLTWMLGDVEIDSGFRADKTEAHLEFLAEEIGLKK
jgi:hypothetical protein